MDEEKRKLFEKRVENYEKAIEEKYGKADLISYTVEKTTSLFVTIKPLIPLWYLASSNKYLS